MGLRVNAAEAMRNPMTLLQLRMASQNARHAAAKLGVARLREEGLTPEQIDKMAAQSPRGFYSWITQYGYDALNAHGVQFPGELGRVLKDEFTAMELADRLFGGFSKVSTHDVLGLKLSAYPKLSSIEDLKALYPQQYQRYLEVKALLEKNMTTPAGTASPVRLLEDHPGWATEAPDIRNLRGNMDQAVAEAKEEAREIAGLVNSQYSGAMSRIENVVIFGLGANDMYKKDLPQLVNADLGRRRSIYSVFEPSQLDELPSDVRADNTLYIAISRGGNTEEIIKCLYFAKKQGLLKYLVGYANKGLVKEFIDREDGISRELDPNIGGRYMWAKGKIVLVPFALAASDKAWEEYTGAMVEFDNQFWPVGEDKSILQLAGHLYMYMGAYNIPGLFMCSNNPTLEAGLRQPFQLHNEAVGTIGNSAIAYGAGMEMLPFAHAGADGILGAAISALVYGGFIFDTSYSYDPATNAALTVADLLPGQADHAGLTKELLKMACVFPNQAKFTYAGAPNFMVAMDGVSYRNLATLTAFYQSLMYPYLIMNETNPDSNPNVAMVRSTTAGVLSSVINRNPGESPIDVVQRVIPGLMKG